VYDTLIEIAIADGICVVKVGNEVDIANADVLERYLGDASGAAEKLIVSLEECRYMDSSGIRPLIRLAARLGDGFFLVVPNGTQIRRIFDLLDLGAQLQVFASVDEALSAAKRNASTV